MSFGVVAKALVVWILLLVLAVINGLLRENVFVPNLGAVPGVVLSGVLLSCIVFAVAYFFLPWLGSRPPSQFVRIGIGWLVLTVIFEFSFGLLRGEALAEILGAYAFQGGNIWPVVLMVTAISPWLAAKLRGWV